MVKIRFFINGNLIFSVKIQDGFLDYASINLQDGLRLFNQVLFRVPSSFMRLRGALLPSSQKRQDGTLSGSISVLPALIFSLSF